MKPVVLLLKTPEGITDAMVLAKHAKNGNIICILAEILPQIKQQKGIVSEAIAWGYIPMAQRLRKEGFAMTPHMKRRLRKLETPLNIAPA